jgi:hypothetical protein
MRWSVAAVILVIAASYAYASFVLWVLNTPGAGPSRKFYEVGLLLLLGNVVGLVGGLSGVFLGRLAAGLCLGLLVAISAVPATFAAIFGVKAVPNIFAVMFMLLRGY